MAPLQGLTPMYLEQVQICTIFFFEICTIFFSCTQNRYKFVYLEQVQILKTTLFIEFMS